MDVWPWLNGRCILSGVNLLEMNMSDMLDVIHYMFEEDLTPVFVEKPQEAKSKVRSSIYESFYERPYKNAITSDDEYDAAGDGATKPYMPPTNPEDFDKVLGAPVGG